MSAQTLCDDFTAGVIEFVIRIIHCKCGTPFFLVFVFGDQVHMQMMAGVSVHAVIDLVRMEFGMDCNGSVIDIFNESGSFFSCQFAHFGNVEFGSDDAAAGMCLIAEDIENGSRKLTDFVAEHIDELAFGAICAVGIFVIFIHMVFFFFLCLIVA